MKYEQQLLTAIQAALEAGQEILAVYGTEFTVETKADQSPLTEADRRSHDVIMRHIEQFDIPILSEEGQETPYGERKAWDKLWIVDPLDGTKEFIKRNGEFTVNIALVEDEKPVMGVIFVPVTGVLYFADRDVGCFRAENPPAEGFATLEKAINLSGKLPLAVERFNDNPMRAEASSQRPSLTIVGSRSHATPELEAFVEGKRKAHGQVDFIAAGSSLKICLVAEGRADIYPRLGPTMEWDTAAGQAIAECAGATVLRHDNGKSLEYNKENLLNPWFIVSR